MTDYGVTLDRDGNPLYLTWTADERLLPADLDFTLVEPIDADAVPS